MNEFVNLDLTRVSVNWHKDQAQIGSKATIMTKGWAVTNKLLSGQTPTAGDVAVLSSSGLVAVKAAPTSYNSVANPEVGRFRSKVDESGYVRLYVDL
jgi:hypothetical protein